MGLRSAFLDLLYPPACPACRRILSEAVRGELCENCEDQVTLVEAPFCSRCGQPFDGAVSEGFDCQNCRELDLAFDSARAPCRNTGPIREMVHRLKYNGHRNLRLPLAALMATALDEMELDPTEYEVTAVPLFPRRKRERGYNQSTEIARELVRLRPQFRYRTLLKRTRMTQTQTSLSRDERLQNLKGAFAPTRAAEKLDPGWKVLLIDDVLTTGATAHGCALTLREAGAGEIQVLTAARG